MNPNTGPCPACGTTMAIGHHRPQRASDHEEAHHNPNDDSDYMDDCKEQE